MKNFATVLKEARKLGIPIVAIVDTNADPEEVDLPIPGNDDAIRAIKLITRIIAEAVIAGREISKPVEESGGAGEIAVPLEASEEAPKEAAEEVPQKTPEEVAEEARALSEEERLEGLGLATTKQETEEKRTGF